MLEACASTPREGQAGTWITRQMVDAFTELHRLGHAHSIEVFAGERLVGGLYGVAVGQMFFGESMYSGESGGSKVALAALLHRLHEWGWPLLDPQVENAHLLRLGAERWPRERFLEDVEALTARPGEVGPWTSRFGQLAARDLAPAGRPEP